MGIVREEEGVMDMRMDSLQKLQKTK